jgi:hypothetical protein
LKTGDTITVKVKKDAEGVVEYFEGAVIVVIKGDEQEFDNFINEGDK